jgi:hypothetical protein
MEVGEIELERWERDEPMIAIAKATIYIILGITSRLI